MVKTDTTLDVNSPTWLRVVLAVLGKGGITGLIAVVLTGAMVYMFWQQNKVVQAKLEVIHAEIITAKAAMNSFATGQNSWNEKREDLLEKQLRLMRQMCVMAADTKAQISACTE